MSDDLYRALAAKFAAAPPATPEAQSALSFLLRSLNEVGTDGHHRAKQYLAEDLARFEAASAA